MKNDLLQMILRQGSDIVEKDEDFGSWERKRDQLILVKKSREEAERDLDDRY